MFLHIYTTNSTNFLNPFIYINYFQSNPIFFYTNSHIHHSFICIHLNQHECCLFLQQLRYHYLLYFIHLQLYLLQDCLSGTSIYEKVENLLTLILIKTSIYSKIIEILKHCIFQNVCIKFLT